MGLLSFFKKKTKSGTHHRGYSGAKYIGSLSKWISTVESADSILKSDLITLRARARDLGMNDPYIKFFLTMVKIHVVGPQGFKLQIQVPDQDILNNQIEKRFRKWSKKGNCTICGAYSFTSLCHQIIRNIARDGEVLLRFIYVNKQFYIQTFEADFLDETYCTILSNGNDVRMGVEYDPFSRPVAYYFFTSHPGDTGFQGKGRKRIRIPASEILHIYERERISQSRGVPWMASVISRIKNMNGFDESAIINAKVTAAKQGFYTKPIDTDDDYDGEETIQPEIVSEFSAGTIDELPAGWDFKAYDSKYPDAQYGPFKKAFLQSIATGLGVSYNNLAKDLENVNFSSIRQGTLDDRDVWRTLQFWLIEELAEPIFYKWFEHELLTGAIQLPQNINADDIEPVFRPRGWSWIDPLKDVKANKEAVKAGFKSSQDVVSEQGGDIEDTYYALEKEQNLREKRGIKTDLTEEESIIVDKKEDNDDEETEEDEEDAEENA